MPERGKLPRSYKIQYRVMAPFPTGSHIVEGAGSFTNPPYNKQTLDFQPGNREILRQRLKSEALVSI